jgi:hypothetical protein
VVRLDLMLEQELEDGVALVLAHADDLRRDRDAT